MLSVEMTEKIYPNPWRFVNVNVVRFLRDVCAYVNFAAVGPSTALGTKYLRGHVGGRPNVHRLTTGITLILLAKAKVNDNSGTRILLVLESDASSIMVEGSQRKEGRKEVLDGRRWKITIPVLRWGLLVGFEIAMQRVHGIHVLDSGSELFRYLRKLLNAGL